MLKRPWIAAAMCALSAISFAKPFALGATFAPLCSFAGTDTNGELAQALILASSGDPAAIPGPGAMIGGFAEFSPLSFLALGASLGYGFRSSFMMGLGAGGDGDSIWIASHTIELGLYGGFNVYKGDAGILRADIGVLAGLMPVGYSQRTVIDGYEIGVSGESQASLTLGARAAVDWEWPLGIPAKEGSFFALRTGLGFDYVFLRTNFDDLIPVVHSMSPSLRIGFVYRSSGGSKASREPEEDSSGTAAVEEDGVPAEVPTTKGSIKP